MTLSRRYFVKNVVTGLYGQLIVIILGIIIPRIMIDSYGSDVNGIVSTTSQIFSYLALLEAGIGQSARNALYKPVLECNKVDISIVFVTAKNYYRKISVYYAVGVLSLAFVLPLFFKSKISYHTIFLIVLIEGMSGVINFYFIQTPSILLNVDQKNYINNSINLANRIVCYISKIVLPLCGASIVIVQLAFFLFSVTKALIYRSYFNKKYDWINFNVKVDKNILKDRSSYLITEVSWTIFSSTDMIVLSLIVSTSMSSVYSVYNLIFTNISLLLYSVSGGILYILGNMYYKNKEDYTIVHDSFTSFVMTVITILMSVSNVLCIPFVKLYTKDIVDVNYIYLNLPFLFASVQILSWSRYVSGYLTGIAGYAKSTSYISFLEAIMNVILSIIFAYSFGIAGVLIATVLSLPLKVIWCIYISDYKILNRNCFKTIIIISSNYLMFFFISIAFNNINLNINNYYLFCVWGGILLILLGIVIIFINLLINKECYKTVKRYIFKS